MANMLAYIIASMVFTPSILLALDMVTCDKSSAKKWTFNPAQNRCDAAFLLGSTLCCMMFIFVIIVITQQGSSPSY